MKRKDWVDDSDPHAALAEVMKGTPMKKRKKIVAPGYADSNKDQGFTADGRKKKKPPKREQVLTEEELNLQSTPPAAHIAKRLIQRIRALQKIGETLVTIDCDSAFTLAEHALPRKKKKK